MFATIADRYDFTTRFLSYGQDRRWKQGLIQLAQLTASDRLLDLACGTGDLMFEAAPHVGTAVGVDVTHRMVQLARRRAVKARPTIFEHEGTTLEHEAVGRPFRGRLAFLTADMLSLPFPEATFDVVTTGYGLRNVPDLDSALREIHRVLTPAGRMLSLDFDRPDNAVVRAAYFSYLTVVGSVLGLVLHRDPDTYRYIPESIRSYPGAHGVATRMQSLGFRDVRVVPLLGGLMAINVGTRG